jgi:hypothetical protein
MLALPLQHCVLKKRLTLAQLSLDEDWRRVDDDYGGLDPKVVSSLNLLNLPVLTEVTRKWMTLSI